MFQFGFAKLIVIVLGDQPIEWSTCSIDALWASFTNNHTDICLRNLPPADSLPASCGNYFVDKGKRHAKNIRQH